MYKNNDNDNKKNNYKIFILLFIDLLNYHFFFDTYVRVHFFIRLLTYLSISSVFFQDQSPVVTCFRLKRFSQVILASIRVGIRINAKWY